MLEIKLRKGLTLVKAIPRLQMCGNCLVRVSRAIGGTRKEMGLLMGPTHNAGFASIPSSFLRVGSTLSMGSPCTWDRDQITGETNCCIVRVTSKDILGSKRALPSRGRGVLIQDILPTTAQHVDVAVLELEEYLRVKVIHGTEEFVSYGLNEMEQLRIQYLRTLGPGQ